MYEKFLNYFTDYIFVKDEPQKADVIFVPGNGYPQMAAHAAELWKEGFAPYVLPSGRYSTVLGHFAGVQDLAEQYGGMGIPEGCTDEKRRAGESDSARRQGDVYV